MEQQQQQQAAAAAAVAAAATALSEQQQQQQPSTQALSAAATPAAAAAAAPDAPQQADGGVAAAVPSPRQPAVVRRAEDSKVLKLKGLPYSTSDKDIIEFFAEYNVIEVAFVYEPDGRPSGLAFAEFATREEALKALSKNGKYLGDRYVRLLHVPKQEMEEQVRLGTLAIPGAQAKMRQKMLRNSAGYLDGPYGGDGGLPGGMLGGPPGGHGGPHQGGGGMGGHDHLGGGYGHLPGGGLMGGGMGQQGMGGMGMGGPGGMGGHHGMLPGSMGAPEQQQPLQMGNPQGRGLPGNMGGMPPHMALAYQLSGMGISGPPRPANNAMGVMQMMPPHGYGGPGAGAGGPPPMAVIGTDSKTIKIRGLPFRATPLDIFNFFDSYEIIAESLQLGVDALGRPSGEAWLTFSSADEALRAVRERNRHYLGNRYLELSLT